MNLEFWIEEVQRLYKEGWKLQRAILFVQILKNSCEMGVIK